MHIDRYEALERRNQVLQDQLTEAIRTNRALADQRARENALVKVVPPERGAQRPNRPKLTPHDVETIRGAYRNGMRQKDLASNFGVNRATISRVVRGIYH